MEWTRARLFDHYCETPAEEMRLIARRLQRVLGLPIDLEALLSAQELAATHVIVGDDASHYLRMKIHAEGGSVDLDKMIPPVCVPPFDHCFVEAVTRPIVGMQHTYNAIGCHFIRLDLHAMAESDQRYLQRLYGEIGYQKLITDARWLVLALTVVSLTPEKARENGVSTTLALPAGFALFPLTPEGGVPQSPEDAHAYAVYYDTTFGVDSYNDPLSHARDRETVLYIVSSMLYCLGFANAKNVKLQEVKSPARLNAARVRRGRKPFVSYSMIDIGPTVKRLQEAERAGIPLAQRMHFVRGHFKSYTQEKPLMGKHAGQYWWEAHVRGKLEEGIVWHDYRVGKKE